MTEPFRVGVDIGGTFTDLVMLDSRSGRLFTEKVLTTPQDPSMGALEGLEKILARNGARPGQVRAPHSRHHPGRECDQSSRGAGVALITTAGFRDILEIGTEWRYDTYDLFMEMPRPLVPRHWRFEVPERMGPEGDVLQALDEEAVVAVAREIAAAGVDAVAISLLHGFRNPVHEHRVREIIIRELPDLVVCISSEVMPEIGEYERSYTTVCNAYVLPIFERYLGRLTDGLRRMGIESDLYLMLSDGGTVHQSTAVAHPIRLVQSGPAGGVQATSAIANMPLRDILCSTWATTASLPIDDASRCARRFEVARSIVSRRAADSMKIPVIEYETRRRGGSIARVTISGCAGGPETPAPTPAPLYGRAPRRYRHRCGPRWFLAAGIFWPDTCTLDVERHPALVRNGAEPLGVSGTSVLGVHETVNEKQAQGATYPCSLEKARNIGSTPCCPRAGPVHALHIAMKIVPAPGWCPLFRRRRFAFVFLSRPPRSRSAGWRHAAGRDSIFSGIGAMLAGMQREGRELLSAQAWTRTARVECLAACAISARATTSRLRWTTKYAQGMRSRAIRRAFERAYEAQFGRVERDMGWQVCPGGSSFQARASYRIAAAPGAPDRQGC